MSPRRSQGAIALARIVAGGVTHAQIARACGVNRSLISYWISSKRSPTVENRVALRNEYGIDVAAWDRFGDKRAKVTATKSAPKGATRSSRAKSGAAEAEVESPTWALDMTRRRAVQLAQFFDETLAQARLPTTDLAEKLKAAPALAATLNSLGKLTGETRDLSEAYIIQLPAFRRILEEMRAGLEPFPPAMRAVGERLLKYGAEV